MNRRVNRMLPARAARLWRIAICCSAASAAVLLGSPAHPAQAASPMNRLGQPARKAAELVRLKDYANATQVMQAIAHTLSKNEINVALLGGKKYMVNNCLGIKASAGKFRIRLENSRFELDGTGARFTFGIDRIGMSALKIRMRPNPGNPLKVCKFSKRFEVGGAASDVRVEMRLDPLLDVKQCRLGSIGKVRTKFRIGGLNLKPLQNNLDGMAKNMIEDSMTYLFENMQPGSAVNQIVQTINDVLEADCPAKKL